LVLAHVNATKTDIPRVQDHLHFVHVSGIEIAEQREQGETIDR